MYCGRLQEDAKVQLQLFAPGGLSKAPAEDYPLYENTAGYMELGGIEKLSDDDYYSLTSQNGIGLLVAMEQWWHGIIPYLEQYLPGKRSPPSAPSVRTI